jgi:hypothetical protein
LSFWPPPVPSLDAGDLLQLHIWDPLEAGLHVEDRCPIQCFEIAHVDSLALDREDLDEVEPNRVRAIG